MVDQLKHMFLEEAGELLVKLESSLLRLEKDTQNGELISEIFRILHTIKGSAGMFDYSDISMFTHDIETVFDLIRNEEVGVTGEIIDLTLRAKDHIEKLLFKDPVNQISPTDTTEIIEAFRNILKGHNEQNNKEESRVSDPDTITREKKEINDGVSPEKAAIKGKTKAFLIQFRPYENILANGTNPVLLINELRTLGECILAADSSQIPGNNHLDPEKCYIGWNIVVITKKDLNAIDDVFIFVEDECELKISPLDEPMAEIWDIKNEIEQLLKKNPPDLTCQLNLMLSLRKKAGPPAMNSSSAAVNRTEKSNENETHSNIKVSSEKLDYLVNLVGELVTVQARLSQTVAARNDSELNSISEEIERLTCELRDNTLNIRMVPIGSTFSRFRRLVRDLGQELGKKVELITEGDDTELDKNVIDKLNDPLVHIIRNCIDHGIEASDIRTRSGKEDTGKIFLSAGYSGSDVVVSITDDGAGISKEQIIRKAVEKGLITESLELNEKEIFNLLFAPGFSTAAEVTSISGRGVGMDVVRKTIEELRGSIGISSEYGIGTTISLRLPLTLAIIEGLLVQIGEESFIIPLTSVEECIEMQRSREYSGNDMHLVNVRGELVPFISLRDRFGIRGEKNGIAQCVITRDGDSKTGFVVDKVIGEHQTVIKSLGKLYRDVEGISGATILGDGTVALILDIHSLIRQELEIEKQLILNR